MSFNVNVTTGSFKESQILRETAKLKLEVTQIVEKAAYHDVGDGYKAIVDTLIDLKKKHAKLDRETFDRHFLSIAGTTLDNKSDMGGLFPGGGLVVYDKLVKKLVD